MSGEAFYDIRQSMETDKLKNDLMIGETSSIEFKRCGNEV